MQSPGFLQRKLAAFGWEDTFCQSGHGWWGWGWGWELVNITACCPFLSNFFRCTPVIQKVTPRSNLADYPSDQRSFVSNSFWVRAAPIWIRNYLFRNLYSIYRREYRGGATQEPWDNFWTKVGGRSISRSTGWYSVFRLWPHFAQKINFGERAFHITQVAAPKIFGSAHSLSLGLRIYMNILQQ